MVVDCDAQTQVQRVVARSGLKVEEVERIIAQQAPRDHRLASADVVIFNQGLSLIELEAQVGKVATDFGL